MKLKNIYVLSVVFILIVLVSLYLLYILGIFVSNQYESSTFSAQLIEVDSIHGENYHNHIHAIQYDSINEQLFLATHFGIYVVENSDLFWLNETSYDYMAFVINKENPQIMYASGHAPFTGNLGVMKSKNGGKNWSRILSNIGTNRPLDFHSMALSIVNSDNVVGYYHGAIYNTQDGGINWQRFNTNLPSGACAGAPCLVFDTQNPQLLYGATFEGLFKSKDVGKTWELIEGGIFGGVGVNPQNSQELLLFRNFEIVRKNLNLGDEEVMRFLNLELKENEFILQFEYDLNDENIVYIFTSNSNVYRLNLELREVRKII
ncbi:MAG: hypothetical protein LAT82_01040 [Nanoarchaeota archaeon]|nr:hypothetical protein [Nanoarchaeota archaeon]